MSYLDHLQSSVICQEENFTCPEGWMKLDTVFQPASWANVVSSLAAVICCVFMFVTYCCFRDFRTGTRRVATSLAVANLFLALGSLVGAVNFLVFSYLTPDVRIQDVACTAFGLVCQIQAFVTLTSAFSSFIWTIILSGTLYVALVKRTIEFLSKPLVWLIFFLSSVLIPVVIFAPIIGTNNLGYSPFAVGAGCFISTTYQYTLTSTSLVSFVKGLEVVSYCVVILFFVAISFGFQVPVSFEQHGVKKEKLEYKLLAIPFFFVFFRLWGTLVVFLTIGLYYGNQVTNDGCVPEPAGIVLYVLTFLQAIGDPSQGWANAIPFIFLSAKIRRKMVTSCLSCLSCFAIGKKSSGLIPQHEHSLKDITSESKSASSQVIDENKAKLLPSSALEMKEQATSDSDEEDTAVHTGNEASDDDDN